MQIPTARHRSMWIALAIAVLASTVPARAQATQKQVLVLYATRQDAQIVTTGDRELPHILTQGDPVGIDYYSEFIDQNRFSQPAYAVAFRESFRLKYERQRFALVIAVGAVPLQFVEANRARLFADVPVVFFSDASRDRPPNSTGLIAELNLHETVEFALALQPDLRHLFVIVSARSSMKAAAESQLKPFTSRLDVRFLVDLPTEELGARLGSLPPNSAVYYLSVDRDRLNQNFRPLDYLDAVTIASNAPVYSWVDSAMDHGVLGGSMKDQLWEIREIGAIGLRVLRGESADAIPISSRNLNIKQVDWRQLRRWGISEARLPAGTRIMFREQTAWDRYRQYILAAILALVAQAGLIAGLLIQNARRRRAEAQVLGGQVALRTSYERIRDLGARLLDAQENERSRIARELHDDISQQLALLEIDLEMLRSSPDDADTLTEDLLQRTHSIARSVHDLSHRLHPAKLRLIGLVGALQGLQRELSQTNLAITLSHVDVPASLPPDVTLCVFRVVQEALHNAIKYSKGRKVSVQLTAVPDRLDVVVLDDGVGFDVRAESGHGIGLVSMRERIEALGGTLQIDSRPGAGTRLNVSVPMSPAAAVAAVAV